MEELSVMGAMSTKAWERLATCLEETGTAVVGRICIGSFFDDCPVYPEQAAPAAKVFSLTKRFSLFKVLPKEFYLALAHMANEEEDWKVQKIIWIQVNCEVIEAVCRLLTHMSKLVKEDSGQSSSEVSVPQLTREGELVGTLHVVPPMSVAAWRMFATWWEAEEGIVEMLRVQNSAACSGEFEVVKRVRRMPDEPGEVDAKYEERWTNITGSK